MKTTQCPYCKEEIKARATICKHCHERLFWSREERVMAAISERIEITAGTRIRVPSYSPCRAQCYHFHKNGRGLSQCLNDCEAEEAIAAVAERLNKELSLTFADIIWRGGDIDPLPFEKLVRERFSRLGKP